MKWGIIGTGRMAATFTSAIRRVPGAEIVAVASRSTDRAVGFAQRFGIRRCHTSAAQLAADRAVEIVYVATTHDRHEADVLAAIAERKAVLCEKPLAPDAAAARRILAAAQTAGTFCMEGLWSLCLPVYREAFDRIRRGEIGEVRGISGSFAIQVPYNPDDRLWDRRRYGGALLDRGVYLVALTLALSGDADAVYATSTWAENGVDASTWFMLQTPRRTRGSFAASLEFFGSNEFSVQGTAGHCRFFSPSPCPPGYLLRPEMRLRSAAAAERGAALRIEHWLKRRPLVRRMQQGLMRGSRWLAGGLEHEIIEVERCVSGDWAESPCVPLQRSVRALEIIDRVAALSRLADASATNRAADMAQVEH